MRDDPLPLIFVSPQVDDLRLHPSAFRIYGHISRRCGKGGICWAAIPTIAKDCDLDERTVRTAIATLVSLGLVTVERRPGDSNCIRIADESQWLPLAKIAPPSKNVSGGNKCHPRDDKKRQDHPPQKTSDEVISVEVIPPSNAQDPLDVPSKLNTREFNDAWKRWMNDRRSHKKPKDWAQLFNDQLSWLETFDAATATAILWQSIRNGYQGLFELKNKKPNENRGITHKPSPSSTRNANIGGDHDSAVALRLAKIKSMQQPTPPVAQ